MFVSVRILGLCALPRLPADRIFCLCSSLGRELIRTGTIILRIDYRRIFSSVRIEESRIDQYLLHFNCGCWWLVPAVDTAGVIALSIRSVLGTRWIRFNRIEERVINVVIALRSDDCNLFGLNINVMMRQQERTSRNCSNGRRPRHSPLSASRRHCCRCDPRSLFVVIISRLCEQCNVIAFVKFFTQNFYILIPRLTFAAFMPERSKGLDSSSSIFGCGSSNLPGCSGRFFASFGCLHMFLVSWAIFWSIGEVHPTHIRRDMAELQNGLRAPPFLLFTSDIVSPFCFC